ncbi:MAG: prolyl oligopeptidase family serine peptidase [Ottowia sp.]|uniref:prolyl oligopeptidase family serine peptidase n=1 Tax=unclassified Ottowia TaxID=2645081 RepID=UPI003C30D8BB
MPNVRFTWALLALAALAGCGGSDDSAPEPSRPVYPQTRSGTDSDVYFGRTVADPYRWLENITSTETDDWVRAQNQLTDGYITGMADYAALSKRVAALAGLVSTKQGGSGQQEQRIEGVQGRGGKYYYQIQKRQLKQNFMRPEQSQGFASADNVIYVAESAGAAGKGTALVKADEWRTDPDDHIQLLNHQISEDGRYLVYAMVRNYADLAELHIIDLLQPAYGPVLIIPNVWTGAFTLVDQGIAYATPRVTTDPHVSPHTDQTLYFQRFSGGTAEAWVHGAPFDQLAPGFVHKGYLYYTLSTGNSAALGRLSLAHPQGSAEMILDARAQNKSFSPVALSPDNPDKMLISTSQGAAFNRLIEVDPEHPASGNWREILPNSPPGVTEYVNSIINCGPHYYAEHLVQGSSKLFHYGRGGKQEIPLPGEGSVSMSCDPQTNGLIYDYSSLVQPYTMYQYDPATHETTQGSTIGYAGYDPSQYEMRRLTATSKDGTSFPVYIAHKKGLKPNGEAPAMLYAYGGFDVPILPTFGSKHIPLLESGGIYAIAQVRGGAEFGTAWWEGGRLLNKQNTYDDIAAAAERLIAEGLTQPGKLAMQGESNGGLSTAVLGLQRPDLFAVVFPTVGVLDLVRYDLFSSGFGWHDDYGQITDQPQFENLMKFSPLHNVKPKPYPPTYVFTGKTDGRVMPAHSYKYAATLQNTATGHQPYLLYSFSKDGHSLESNRRQYLTYMWTAFFHHTGTRYAMN